MLAKINLLGVCHNHWLTTRVAHQGWEFVWMRVHIVNLSAIECFCSAIRSAFVFRWRASCFGIL